MLNEAVKITKKDLKSMDPDSILVGFEFEFAVLFKNPKEIDEEIRENEVKDKLQKFFQETFGPNFKIVSDRSVLLDKQFYNTYYFSGYNISGLELVTPPLPMKESLNVLSMVFDILRKEKLNLDGEEIRLVTNDMTGLHVNISVDSNSPYFEKLNKLYVVMLGTLEYLYRDFDNPGKRQVYIKDLKDDLMLFLSKLALTDELSKETILSKNYVEKLHDIIRKILKVGVSTQFEKDIFGKILSDKYRTINLSKDNYIEFRILGGKDYQDKENEVIQNIIKFAFMVWEASTKNKKKFDELVKSLAKKITTYLSSKGTVKVTGTTKLTIDRKDLEKIDLYSRKFDEMSETLRKTFMVLRYAIEDLNNPNVKESNFIDILEKVLSPESGKKYKISVSLASLRDQLEEFFGPEYVDKYVFESAKIAREKMPEILRKIKTDSNFGIKFLYVTRNILDRKDLDIKKVTEEATKKFQWNLGKGD